MAKHIANILTGCRILGSILLLFFPAFSVGFYTVYLLCGISDMIDGNRVQLTTKLTGAVCFSGNGAVYHISKTAEEIYDIKCQGKRRKE